MKNINFCNFQMAFIAMCIVFSTAVAFGTLTLETNVVSGRIDTIVNDEIKLENGQRFLPGPAIKGISFQRADIVTLKYFVNPDGKNVYIEIAPGANTLPGLPPTSGQK